MPRGPGVSSSHRTPSPAQGLGGPSHPKSPGSGERPVQAAQPATQPGVRPGQALEEEEEEGEERGGSPEKNVLVCGLSGSGLGLGFQPPKKAAGRRGPCRPGAADAALLKLVSPGQQVPVPWTAPRRWGRGTRAHPHSEGEAPGAPGGLCPGCGVASHTAGRGHRGRGRNPLPHHMPVPSEVKVTPPVPSQVTVTRSVSASWGSLGWASPRWVLHSACETRASPPAPGPAAGETREGRALWEVGGGGWSPRPQLPGSLPGSSSLLLPAHQPLQLGMLEFIEHLLHAGLWETLTGGLRVTSTTASEDAGVHPHRPEPRAQARAGPLSAELLGCPLGLSLQG